MAHNDSHPSSITFNATNDPSTSTLGHVSRSVNDVDQRVASIASPTVNEGINPVSILVQPQPFTYIEADSGTSLDVVTKPSDAASLPESIKALGEFPRAIRFVEAVDDQKQARIGEHLAQNPRGLFKMTGRKATPHPMKMSTSPADDGS